MFLKYAYIFLTYVYVLYIAQVCISRMYISLVCISGMYIYNPMPLTLIILSWYMYFAEFHITPFRFIVHCHFISHFID